MQTRIKIENIKVVRFDPKTLVTQLEVLFKDGEKQEKVITEYLLKNPEKILNELLLAIKSKNRMIIDDATLNPVEKLEIYSPIVIEKEEETEVKVFNFIRLLCEKANRLKNTKNAKDYMQLFNEFKTQSLKL